MTYQSDETISLTKVADSNLPKEESSSRRKWLAAVAAALIVGGGTMVVSSLSSSNGNPAIRLEMSLLKDGPPGGCPEIEEIIMGHGHSHGRCYGNNRPAGDGILGYGCFYPEDHYGPDCPSSQPKKGRFETSKGNWCYICEK